MSSVYTKYVKLSIDMNYLHKPINQYRSHAGIDVLLKFLHEVCGRPFLCLKFPWNRLQEEEYKQWETKIKL